MRRKIASTGKKSLLMLGVMLVFTVSQVYAQDYTLAWDPNPEPDVSGYKLFYKEAASILSTGSYDAVIDVGNSTQYTVTGLTEGAVYYFAVKAYDLSGAESPYSEEVYAVDEPEPVVEPDPVVEPEPVVEPDPVVEPEPVVNPETGSDPVQGDVDGDGVVDAVDLVAAIEASDVDALQLALSSYGAAAPIDPNYSNIIVAEAGPGGTIFPEADVAVPDGGSRTFLISPEKGYEIDEVRVDGRPASLTEQYVYRFEDVMGDHTIEVYFKPTAELANQQVLHLGFNGDFQDASGWAHHGSSTGVNLPQFVDDRYGRPEKACRFDGVNDFVRVLCSADFSLPEYTLTAWVYGMLDFNSKNPQYIASTNRKDTDDVVGMFAFADSLCAPGIGVPRAENALSGLETQWLHLTVVRTISTVQFYLDGECVGEMPGGYYTGKDTQDLIIGARTKGAATPSSAFFKGIIDEVRLYNLPLEANEIQGMVVMAGDVNRDGAVNEVDVQLFASNDERGDFNGDGKLDMADLVSLAWAFDAGRK